MCDCKDCKAARKQLDDHHPKPEMFDLGWFGLLALGPEAVAQKKYESGWERTFGKKKDKK